VAKRFEIRIAAKPGCLIEHFRRSALEHEFEFVGDESAGRFSGKGIEGAYEIRGDQLLLTIHKKPFFLPWMLVEAAVKDYFGWAKAHGCL
jgi:hypothetical protein